MNSKYHEKKYEVKNHYGIHVRPAAILAKYAKNFAESTEIGLIDEPLGPMHSIMQIMSMGAAKGTHIRVRYHGNSGSEEIFFKGLEALHCPDGSPEFLKEAPLREHSDISQKTL